MLGLSALLQELLAINAQGGPFGMCKLCGWEELRLQELEFWSTVDESFLGHPGSNKQAAAWNALAGWDINGTFLDAFWGYGWAAFLLGRGGGTCSLVPFFWTFRKYFCAWLLIWITVFVPTYASIFFQSRSKLPQDSKESSYNNKLRNWN